MSKTQLKVIKHGSKLVAIGNLFKRTTDKDWQCSTYFQAETFKSGNKTDKYTSAIDLLPFFAKGRVYYKEDSLTFKQTGFEATIELPEKNTWQKQTMSKNAYFSDYLKKEHRELGFQNGFKFETNGKIVFLPSIELARVLFFHASYLCRAAFSPSGLKTLLHVKKQSNEFQIEAFPGSAIPVFHFESIAYRQHLAWILLNSDAEQSFNSIFAHLITNKKTFNNSLYCAFDFDPPELKGCILKVKGKYNNKTNELDIFAITSISKIPQTITDEVIFLHPNSKERISDKNKKTKSNQFSPDPDQKEFDLGNEPSCDTTHREIDSTPVGVCYTQEIKTKRIYAGKQNTKIGRQDEEAKSGKNIEQVGLSESTTSGSIPQAEINQLELNEDKVKRKNTFKKLIKILEELSKQQGVAEFTYQVLPLPKIKRCKLHLKENGSSRLYLHAEIIFHNAKIKHILEIETSDGLRSISTKVIEFNHNSKKHLKAKIIMARTVKNSLVWDKKRLKYFCSTINSINHPQDTTDESINKWKNRLKAAIDT